MSLTMKEWIQNELYSELIEMPLWTKAAFGSLKEGDILTKDDSRYILIKYLVSKHISTVPKDIYDNDYRHNWKVSDYVETIKYALNRWKNNKSSR